jgi:capsular polysaccharide biosynthesis protein
MGYDGDYVVAGLPGFAFEFLRLLGIDGARLIETVEKPTIFKSATFVTSVTETEARKYRELYMLLRSRILATADTGQQKLSRRIWMVRGFGVNEGRYEPSNAEEVYRILERNGFEMVDMATLTLSAQIAAARDAQILAGAHGAAFVHTLFMQPGSTVIECFAPFFINPSVFNICHIMKHRYSMLVHANAYGAYTEPDALMVDPIHLELVLQHCE